jgi:hypothetical protein
MRKICDSKLLNRGVVRELVPDDFDRRLLEWRFGGAARH